MAFYKKTKMKVNGKWYPKSVLVGSPISTEQVAKRLAAESTVSPADVRAVLTALGGVMGDFMAQGRQRRACALHSRTPLPWRRQGTCVYSRFVGCGHRVGRMER